jgi:protein-L-isoaspartate(D-aspartate) O-methyltransferase
MVANIRQLVSAGAAGKVRGLDPRVLQTMGEVPRHLFVAAGLRSRAYRDEALEIGDGATISQPFMVALMTHLARPKSTDAALEVGTGSGYQAAVLSRLVRQVYTIEIIGPLATEASGRLAALGYSNVEVRQRDGYQGWPERGPFDIILVTAGATSTPPALVRQLKPGGRMIIPVGRMGRQELLVHEKDARGRMRTTSVAWVDFVPLVRSRPGRP